MLKYRVEFNTTVEVELPGKDYSDDEIIDKAIEKAGDFPNATIHELKGDKALKLRRLNNEGWK